MKKKATLIFGGDFCPIRRYAEKISSGQAIFDDNLLNIFRDSNFCMFNLETPLCEPSLNTAAPNGYGLRGEPETAFMLKNIGVDAVGLANNHMRDFCDAGVFQTIDNLEKAKLLHTGAGKNLEQAQKPLTINVNGLKIRIWALAEKEFNCATKDSPGTAYFNPESNAMQIPKLKQDVDLLIIYIHAGHEFTDTPSPRIRTTYRKFIDAGADAVIGHHPHVPQGFEKYKNGIIFYSLGNLAFDSDYVSQFADTDVGFLVKLEVDMNGVASFDAIPYSLDKDICVRCKNGQAEADFRKYLHQISVPLNDQTAFLNAWEKNVKKRWNEHLKMIIEDFSDSLKSENNLGFLRMAENFFSCPTHQEMFSHAFRILRCRNKPEIQTSESL